VSRRDRVSDRGVRDADVDVGKRRQVVRDDVELVVAPVGAVDRDDLEAVVFESTRDRGADPPRRAGYYSSSQLGTGSSCG
jgi:hypothetical protein